MLGHLCKQLVRCVAQTCSLARYSPLGCVSSLLLEHDITEEVRTFVRASLVRFVGAWLWFLLFVLISLGSLHLPLLHLVALMLEICETVLSRLVDVGPESVKNFAVEAREKRYSLTVWHRLAQLSQLDDLVGGLTHEVWVVDLGQERRPHLFLQKFVHLDAIEKWVR